MTASSPVRPCLCLLAVSLTSAEAVAQEPRKRPNLQLSASFLVEVASRGLGGEVAASWSAAELVDVGVGVNLGASLGLLATVRLHTAWRPDRRFRPMLQVRAAIHPFSRGFGGGLLGGVMMELGPGRAWAGVAGHLYAPSQGYVPYAAFALLGYELDILGTRGAARAAPAEAPAEGAPAPAPAAGRTGARGQVVDFDARPVPAVRVRITGPALERPVELSSAEFDVELPPGEYQFSFEAKDYLLQGARVTLAKGEVAEVNAMLRQRPTTSTAQLTARSVAITQQIQFELSRARILPESFFILDEVADVLLRNPKVRQVRVEGHTDNLGTAEANRRLSEARALAVMEYLIAKGVEAGRLRGEGFGATRPIADNATEAGRARNRRVQFEIVE